MVFINMKEVSFSSSYFKKNFFKDTFEEKLSYAISFTFSDDKILNFACVLEKNETKRVVKRIEEFLEKQKYILK